MAKQIKNPPFSDEKVVRVSVRVDVLDVLMNATAALVTGSAVMLAETLQGISDLISDSLIYVGIRRSKKKPTKKHPFGYGRELYIWSLFATIIMFLVLASLSFYFGFQRFGNPEPIERIGLAYIILIISLISNGYSFSLSARRLLFGRPFWKIKQALTRSTFLETKITFTSDLLGTLAALLGLIALVLFQQTGALWFDGLGAMAIGLLMAFFSFWLFKHVKDFMVGISAPNETKEKIRKAVSQVKGIEKVLDLKAIIIGSNRLLVHLDIHVRPGLLTGEIEELIDQAEENIKKQVPSAQYIQVELETPKIIMSSRPQNIG